MRRSTAPDPAEAKVVFDETGNRTLVRHRMVHEIALRERGDQHEWEADAKPPAITKADAPRTPANLLPPRIGCSSSI